MTCCGERQRVSPGLREAAGIATVKPWRPIAKGPAASFSSLGVRETSGSLYHGALR